MKPIAIFDIDGTIFRSSLTIELFKELVAGGIFGRTILSKVVSAEKRWLNRAGHYSEYIGEVVRAYQKEIVGKKKSAVVAASRKVIVGQKARTYRFTRDLLNKIRSKYFTIGISGSPLEVVLEYNKFLKFDKIYGTELGVDEQNRYTGVILHEPPRYKKEVIVRFAGSHGLNFKGSLGVGDTETDIGFLELVERPIAFNPNHELAAAACKKNWPIVLERKDLIVEFQPDKVKFLKV